MRRWVWLAVGEHELPPEQDWLSPTEARRLAELRFPKRRTEYLLRRWAGKRAVAAALGRPTDAATLRSVELLNHPTGAPWVRLDGHPAPLELSLTDRAGWAVCLVRNGPAGWGTGPGREAVTGATAGVGPGESEAGAVDPGAVGVDLELVEPRSDGFVEDFLTGAEQRWVRDRPAGDGRDAAANLLWSAKEAALKVLRTGLRADTRSVEVRIAGWPEPGGGAVPERRGPVPDDGGARAASGVRALVGGRHGDGQWHPLEVWWSGGATFPGWWRRDGVFLLTVATQRPIPPPDPLPGTADLGRAVPVHSWLSRPS